MESPPRGQRFPVSRRTWIEGPMNERAVLFALVCLPLLSGRACGGLDQEPEARVERGNETLIVSGEVLYRERILLPPGAVLRIVLEDGRGEILAETSKELAGAPPYAFEVSIDESKVREPRDVRLRAEILRDGAPFFTSREPAPAFDGGRPRRDVEMTLVMAPH